MMTNIKIQRTTTKCVNLSIELIRHMSSLIYVYLDLTRLSSKAKDQVAGGKGINWLIESPTFLIYV